VWRAGLYQMYEMPRNGVAGLAQGVKRCWGNKLPIGTLGRGGRNELEMDTPPQKDLIYALVVAIILIWIIAL